MAAYDTDTIIVGAGPSGLAIAACLTRCGIPYLLLERAARAGAAWRAHYDRLHLHTVKKHSNLPYFPFPDHVGTYPSREDVVSYLDAYARHFNIQPRCGEDVTSIRRANGGWGTASSGGTYLSERVIIASGYNRRPSMPALPGRDDFGGTVIHSAEYRNGEPFRGKRVLVVGIGNTGGEIAIDLHEYGAASVHICVRSPINVIPRDFMGTPAQVSGIMLCKLPRPLRYALSKRIARLAIGDLSRYGIHRPEIGPIESVERYGRVALIDIGTVELIRKGAITVVPGIERFTNNGVAFVDGQSHAYDGVILATGYKPCIADFLENAGEVTDEAGYPIPREGESKWPGLYFLGFTNPATGLIRQIAIEAPKLAAGIAREAAGHMARD